MSFWSTLRSSASLGRSFLSVWRARKFGGVPAQVPVVHITVADRCNSRCLGCDIWKRHGEGGTELTAREIIGLLPALRKLKTRVVSLGGGEPTMREDLEECIRAFAGAGIAVHTVTNGLTLTADRAKSLSEAGLAVVRVSCDHVTPEGYQAIRGVDGYEKAVAAMRHFRQGPRPVSVGVNVVVSRLNQDVLGQFADRAVEWGVQKLQFIPIHVHLQHREMEASAFEPLVPLPEDLPRIIARLREVTERIHRAGIWTNSSYFVAHFDRAYKARRFVPCVSGYFSVILDPFGQVLPCYQMPSGLNVRDMPLDEIVRSERFARLRNQTARCQLACWDPGNTEPDLLFHVPYLLRHPLDAMRQMRFNVPPRRPL